MKLRNKFIGQWKWCGHCKVPCITCEHCNNSSCNVGSCPVCHEDMMASCAFLNLFLKEQPDESIVKQLNDPDHWHELFKNIWNSSNSKNSVLPLEPEN